MTTKPHSHRTGTERRQRVALPFTLLFLIAVSAPASTARAVSFISASLQGSAADLVNNPNDIYSFDGNVITWKMSPEFLQEFPLPKQHEQVRLAFREWDTASFSGLRRTSARYSWRRLNGQKGFEDLRTVMSHEIGHALGSQHPDASWFNNGLNRNFWPDGQGGWIPQPPIGGELMNEGNTEGFLPGQKPPKGLVGGEYNRIVSKDELAMLDHAYNRHLVFQEVFGNTPADILLGTHNENGPPSNNLGSAGPSQTELRVPNDPTQGRRIITADISLNANPSIPMGILATPATWEYTNGTGQPVDALIIRTRGTDNENPISWSSTGAHRFTDLASTDHASEFTFEDLSFGYTDPVGGSIPNTEMVRAGLRLDVWDWTVVSAYARMTNGEFRPACLVSVTEWITLDPAGIPDGPAAAGAGSSSDQPEGIISARPGLIVARGFKISNGDAPIQLSSLEFAPARGLNLGLETMTSATLAELRRQMLVESVPLAPGGGGLSLAPGEELIVILEGTIPRPPGNVIILNRPGLMNDELFIAARSACDGGETISFGLLNKPLFEGCTPQCDGDVNDDGVVNVLDLLAVLANWGPRPANPCADLNEDDVVDVLDLLEVLASWGVCP